MYEILKYELADDGVTVKIVQHDHNSFIATVSKTKEDGINTEYLWKYEAQSFQAAVRWVNRVRKNPLNCCHYESGFDILPHNMGFGNPTKKRMIWIEPH